MAAEQQIVKPASQEPRHGIPNRMSGWEQHSYGPYREVLEFHNNLRFPKVGDPKELIVRVTAASVNPIDLAMTGKLIIFIQKSKSTEYILFNFRWIWSIRP